MNKMKEVANILGVEIGEEFKIKDLPLTYSFHSTGLYDEFGSNCNMSLIRLISGECEIEKIPYKPKYGETYWSAYAYRNNNCCAESLVWTDYMTDFFRYNLGLVFRTEEEAKEIGIPRLKEIIEEYNR